MTLKPWREVVVPHKDVLQGTFLQSEFAADLTAQCDRFLTGKKLRKERRACYKEVPIYVGLVREFGQSVFDANSTVPGTQTEIPGRTTPLILRLGSRS